MKPTTRHKIAKPIQANQKTKEQYKTSEGWRKLSRVNRAGRWAKMLIWTRSNHKREKL